LEVALGWDTCETVLLLLKGRRPLDIRLGAFSRTDLLLCFALK
jgi:hypothetical protein